jgi:diguanylate cyclase
VIVSDPQRTLDVLERLGALGLRLALDDFGAGHSSLAHLKKLRLDELKIDREFVLELTASRADMAIVRSTIDLGHRLGLHVVAEGVATQEAWDLLAEYGCDDAQGHLLAPPMSADELAAWLTSRHAAAQRGPAGNA